MFTVDRVLFCRTSKPSSVGVRLGGLLPPFISNSVDIPSHKSCLGIHSEASGLVSSWAAALLSQQTALRGAESSQWMDKAAGVGELLQVRDLFTGGTGTGTKVAAILWVLGDWCVSEEAEKPGNEFMNQRGKKNVQMMVSYFHLARRGDTKRSEVCPYFELSRAFSVPSFKKKKWCVRSLQALSIKQLTEWHADSCWAIQIARRPVTLCFGESFSPDQAALCLFKRVAKQFRFMFREYVVIVRWEADP